jgi:sugar lactone lactonase YvrE
MGNVVKITSTPPTAITADATRLYWVEEQAGTVHRCDIADCSNTDTLLADGQASPNAIALSRDGATIYWANSGTAAGAGGAVMKLPK